MNKLKKIICLGMISLCTIFSLTGCGTKGEQPAAGVSIAGAENQTLGFTYLYDLGNGYKLYADNFTKIVYLEHDYSSGKGATSVGSKSMCPYISPNGNYYKINTETRVIEEMMINSVTNTTDENQTENSENVETNENSQQQAIEAILNENSQKNENTNNSEQQYQNNAVSNNPQNIEETETLEEETIEEEITEDETLENTENLTTTENVDPTITE